MPSCFGRLFAPENIPNIALVVVGLGAIVTALYTLKAIERQTKATEESAKAAQRTVDLQRIMQQQWLQIAGWRSSAEIK
jgi:hypothetical protein